MSPSVVFAVLAVLTVAGYYMGRGRALSVAGGDIRQLHSVPSYYGFYVALWCGVPALFLVLLWMGLQGPLIEALVVSGLPAELANQPADRMALLLGDIRNVAYGNLIAGNPSPEVRAAAESYAGYRQFGNIVLAAAALLLAVAGLAVARSRIVPHLRARNRVERVINVFLVVCSMIAIVTTIGIVLSLLFESLRFFGKVPVTEFLFGTEWSPQTALRADQVGSSGSFGIVPLFVGTLVISFIAMVVAVPIGLMSAIYMADYAPKKVRATLKPLLEILAGIPTVVYGFFAALTVAPFIREAGGWIGLNVASESALAAGLVMGIMIIPFVSSLSDDVINAVPQSLRDGSYGLGATKSETIRQVILPAALPGIVAAVLLAVSRAIGETMIVVMAAGLAAKLSINPLEALTTVTVQIATVLVGDQEFDSAKTLSAFALGLVLFVVTLCLNVIALRVVQKYREKYD